MDNDPRLATPPVDCILARAALAGSTGSAKTFIAQSDDIDLAAGGRTPLLWAITGGDATVMGLLLDAGANILAKTDSGDNALACAVWSKNLSMIQLMIDKGFDPLAKGSHGKSAFDWAQEDGTAGIVQLMTTYATEVSHRQADSSQNKLKQLAQQRKRRMMGP